MMTYRGERSTSTGFTLTELLVGVSILSIFCGLALTSWSESVANSRLMSTTRELEIWLNDQRNLAMQNGLTCAIAINLGKKEISSRRAFVASLQGCNPQQTSSAGSFSISDQIDLSISPESSEQSKETACILFSFRGFSIGQNATNAQSCGDDIDPSLDNTIIQEIILKQPDLTPARCIKIASPIGLIRDGIDNGNGCTYNTPM